MNLLVGRSKRIIGQTVIILVRLYQYFLSPLLGPGCRYTPSCSQYSIQSIRKHGIFKGSYLTLTRIMCCHPWSKNGYDPVP